MYPVQLALEGFQTLRPRSQPRRLQHVKLAQLAGIALPVAPEVTLSSARLVNGVARGSVQDLPALTAPTTPTRARQISRRVYLAHLVHCVFRPLSMPGHCVHKAHTALEVTPLG